jgi:sulfur carrier protein ThiS
VKIAIVRPVGTLRNYIGGQTEIAVDAGRTVRETMTALGIPPEIVALVLVNDVQQAKDYVVQDGDVVKLIAVIGGGRAIGP